MKGQNNVIRVSDNERSKSKPTLHCTSFIKLLIVHMINDLVLVATASINTNKQHNQCTMHHHTITFKMVNTIVFISHTSSDSKH